MPDLAAQVRQHADRYDTDDPADKACHYALTTAAALIERDALRVGPLGKAGPRTTRPGLPSIGSADEAQHPEWPAVDLGAEPSVRCEQDRADYDRTRCADSGCLRCWLGGPLNWPSLKKADLDEDGLSKDAIDFRDLQH